MSDLLIDIGNTRLKWRLQEQGLVQCAGVIPVTEVCLARLQSDMPSSVKQVCWASVAADAKGMCLEAWAGQNNIPCRRVITQESYQDLTNGYRQIESLGVDRWLAMVAARQHTKKAVCVVDCGSAITFDYINADGLHEGGYIIPGARLMVQALVRDTAHIDVAHQAPSELLLGLGTPQAVLSGCYQMAHHGACSLVTEARTRGYEILLCGGDGLAIASHLGLTYVEELVLDGLSHVAGVHKH